MSQQQLSEAWEYTETRVLRLGIFTKMARNILLLHILKGSLIPLKTQRQITVCYSKSQSTAALTSARSFKIYTLHDCFFFCKLSVLSTFFSKQAR